MARTKTKPFWQRMRDARDAVGLSLDEVGYRVRDIAPAHWRSSRATVNRLEQPEAKEESADPVLLQILAVIYGVELAELSPIAAEQFDRILELPTLSIRDMWPYTQLALYLDDWHANRAGDQWKILASSTSTAPLNELEDCLLPPSAATESCTPPSPAGVLVAA